MEPVEDRVRRLSAQQQATADREEIAAVLARYCRAIDRLDVDLLKSVFHPDAVNRDLGEEINAHEWAESVIPALATLFTGTMHHITSLDVTLDGSRAVSESYYIAFHRLAGGRGELATFAGSAVADAAAASGHLTHEYVGAGRYLHRWEKRDGAWRMSSRVCTFEFNELRPMAVAEAGSLMARMPQMARRDRGDPVYALLTIPRR